MKELPFREAFRPALLSGEKTLTLRGKAYGKPGDVLLTIAGPVELLHVERVSLGFVAAVLHGREGCASPEDFLALWKEIHPARRFDLAERFYLHHFARLQPGDPRWLVPEQDPEVRT
jgi:hypothetical protein